MTEQKKVVLPAYIRVCNCSVCGAAVYSPELIDRGGWPLMSACDCANGPDIASERVTGELKRAGEFEREAKAA